SAHDIDARNQHGIEIFLGIDGKQAAKAADLAEHTAGEGLMGKILDPILGTVGAVDVYASVGIGDSAIRGVVGHGNQSVFMRRRGMRWVSVKREKRSSAAHCSTFESAPDSFRSLGQCLRAADQCRSYRVMKSE